jgi:hypothetical protein
MKLLPIQTMSKSTRNQNKKPLPPEVIAQRKAQSDKAKAKAAKGRNKRLGYADANGLPRNPPKPRVRPETQPVMPRPVNIDKQAMPMVTRESVFADSMNWPKLVGSAKQITWAENIRHKWMQVLLNPDSVSNLPLNAPQVYALYALMSADPKASNWIQLQQQHATLTSYILFMRESSAKTAFMKQLNGVKPRDAAMTKMLPEPVLARSYEVVLHSIIPGSRAMESPPEQWLNSQHLMGAWDVVYQGVLDDSMTGTFSFFREDDAVRFKKFWINHT